jgi:hypothetical protein
VHSEYADEGGSAPIALVGGGVAVVDRHELDDCSDDKECADKIGEDEPMAFIRPRH